MINFIEGKISTGAIDIRTTFDIQDLKNLAKKGLIEQRVNGRGKIYYYTETLAGGMRFGAFIRLREKRIEWLRLHWLDSPMRSWDDVSENGVKHEYLLLSEFIERSVESPPDKKGNRRLIWRFKWGELEVCYDLRAFQADIFMRPR
ncbi:hypothetical protein [Pseudoduganella buxea]|uniref:Uncharacterized protein n=1 Tax=Pseudoduganella buxea TaxID=1949069 RepID=A0A6I3T4M0_9BURK|nr:hypothetical protein [Pseudoduganella buxea]MTV56394.1 hypothetical protein [Pseudoduganella buxea]